MAEFWQYRFLKINIKLIFVLKQSDGPAPILFNMPMKYVIQPSSVVPNCSLLIKSSLIVAIVVNADGMNVSAL